MMMLFESNLELMSHEVVGKKAVGVPQLSVSTEPAPLVETSEGGDPLRGQNQILMKLFVRSVAYHPPPFALKAGP